MPLNASHLLLQSYPDPREDIIYIVIGSIGAVANCLILASILLHRALRRQKEYSLLGLLVLFNALMSLGLLFAGIYRLTVGPKDGPIPQMTCLRLPHSILLSGVPCVSSVLLPFIAIDRLVAISRPLEYRVRQAYKGYYAKLVTLFALLFYGICFFYASADTLTQNRLVAARCDTREVFSPGYKLFESILIVICHLIAVCLFTIVIGHFHCYAKQRPIRRESKSGAAALRQQTRVVRTFSIFSVMTLCLVVVPFMAVFILSLFTKSDGPHSRLLNNAYLWTVKIAVMNPTLNVVVYALRHNEIYVGVRSLLVRQPMPDSTEQWCVSRGIGVTRSSLGRSMSCPDTPPRFKYSLAHYRMVQDLQQRRETVSLAHADERLIHNEESRE